SVRLRLRAHAADALRVRAAAAAVRVGRAFITDLLAAAGRGHADRVAVLVRVAEARAALVALIPGVAHLLAGLERPVAAHVDGAQILPGEPEGGVARVLTRLRVRVHGRDPELLPVLVGRVRRGEHLVAVVARGDEDDPAIPADGDGVHRRLIGDDLVLRVERGPARHAELELPDGLRHVGDI